MIIRTSTFAKNSKKIRKNSRRIGSAAFGNVLIIPEYFNLKILALRSFVARQLAVRIHSRKLKIHLSDYMQTVHVWKSLQTIRFKFVRNNMNYMVRCALISSFQRWKPQVFISLLEKTIQKTLAPLPFWNGQ